MAKFSLELPSDLMQAFKMLDANTEKMFGEMCEAGAEVVKELTWINMPKDFRNAITLTDNLILSKVYKTPSDDGINVQCMIVGYFQNENKKRTPAPLVANMFEYGSNKKKYPKHPFFRKSFRKDQIERAMMAVQQKYIKGD